MHILLKILLFYILYQFIFRIVIPLVKTYIQIQKKKKRFENNFSSPARKKKKPQAKSPKKDYGEYIDFEEVKLRKK